MSRVQITALGSSFAAGSGIKPVINRAAMRSAVNYPHLLAQKLEADLTDLTAASSKLGHVLDQRQSLLRNTFPPQLDCMPSNTDIVTLTAGGNDMGYSLGMILDSAASWLGPLKGWIRKTESVPLIEPPELIARLSAVIKRIKSISPKARIYLVEYLNVFGVLTRPSKDTPLNRERIDHYMGQAQVMSEVYGAAANSFDNVKVVPMSEISRGHELGSAVPWVDGFGIGLSLRGTVAYHPNRAGHEAIAEAVYAQLKKDIDQPSREP